MHHTLNIQEQMRQKAQAKHTILSILSDEFQSMANDEHLSQIIRNICRALAANLTELKDIIEPQTKKQQFGDYQSDLKNSIAAYFQKSPATSESDLEKFIRNCLTTIDAELEFVEVEERQRVDYKLNPLRPVLDQLFPKPVNLLDILNDC